MLVGLVSLVLSGCGSGKLAIAVPAHGLYDSYLGCASSHRTAKRCPSRFDLRGLLGLSVDQAKAKALARGLTIEAVMSDGRRIARDLVFDPARIDVAVRQKTVTKILRVG